MSCYEASQEVTCGQSLCRNIAPHLVHAGEQRRLTTAEMLMLPTCVGVMDSITTGLDSASTYDIISTIRHAAKEFHYTLLISLLQPPPEVLSVLGSLPHHEGSTHSRRYLVDVRAGVCTV